MQNHISRGKQPFAIECHRYSVDNVFFCRKANVKHGVSHHLIFCPHLFDLDSSHFSTTVRLGADRSNANERARRWRRAPPSPRKRRKWLQRRRGENPTTGTPKQAKTHVKTPMVNSPESKAQSA
jgi:hypothetical protein